MNEWYKLPARPPTPSSKVYVELFYADKVFDTIDEPSNITYRMRGGLLPTDDGTFRGDLRMHACHDGVQVVLIGAYASVVTQGRLVVERMGRPRSRSGNEQALEEILKHPSQ